MLNYPIIIALATLAFYATVDTMLKLPSSRMGNAKTLIFFLGISIIPLFISLFYFPSYVLNGYVYLMSALYGIFFFLGWFYLARSLETEQVSNANAFTGVEYAIIVLFGAFGLSEAVTSLQWVGIIMAFIGVFLVALKDNLKINLKLIPALFGCVMFGLSGIAAVYAIKGAGNFVMPMFIGRIVSFLLILAYLALFAPSNGTNIAIKKKEHRAMGIASFAGLLEGFGVVSWSAFVYLGSVALGNAIVGMEPAAVIFLGYFLYKDRFSLPQILGFLLVLSGIMLLILT